MPAIYVSKTRAAFTTSDIALSGSAVIASETAINYVVNTNGNYTWNIGGNDNKDGLNGASEVMRINASGNVGIGTDAPSASLEVNGEIGIASSAGGYRFLSAVNGSVRGGLTSTNSNDLQIRVNNGEVSTTFLANGKVGIGTDSPLNKLEVHGSGDATTTTVNYSEYTASFLTDTAVLSIGSVNGKPCLQSSGAGTAYHLLLSPFKGNVGIGIDTPVEKLHVNGKIRANDYDLEILPPLSTAP